MEIEDQERQVKQRISSAHTAPAPGALSTNPADHSATQFERLANQWGCSTQFVRDLYQQELELLQHNAQVHGFIPVLALKQVRNALRRQRQPQSTSERR
jgi:hypothetical protein